MNTNRFLMFQVIDPYGLDVEGLRFPNVIEARARVADLGEGYDWQTRWVSADQIGS